MTKNTELPLSEYFFSGTTPNTNSPSSINAASVEPAPKGNNQPSSNTSANSVTKSIEALQKSKTTATGEIPSEIVLNPPERVPKVDDMKEATNITRHGVMMFGRFNPPHAGHEKAVGVLRKLAAEHNTKGQIFVSHVHDRKRNPIDPETKAALIQDAFGDEHTVIHTSSKSAPTPIHAAKKLFADGVTHLHVVAGDDRVEDLTKMFERVNGKETKLGTHFTFQQIKVHSSGSRDSGEISATKMREFAEANDAAAFKKHLPKKLQSRHEEVMAAVKRGKSLQESKNKTVDILKRNLVAKDLHVSGLYKPKTEKSGKQYKREKVGRWNLNKYEALDVATPSVEKLADKHNMTKKAIQKLISAGAKVEKEHTKSAETAKEIARDHIGERPDYYARLKKVEGVEESVLSFSNRTARAARVRRNRIKLTSFRKIDRHKLGTDANLKMKQIRYARQAFRTKLGIKNYNTMPAAAKIAVDKQINSKSRILHNAAVRMRPHVKQAEVKRLNAVHSSKPAAGAKKFLRQKHMIAMGMEYDRADLLEALSIATKLIGEDTVSALCSKAAAKSVPPEVIIEVYQRGLDDYATQDGVELDAAQWAFNRVNSFLAGGMAASLDSDLYEAKDGEALQYLIRQGLVSRSDQWKTINSMVRAQKTDYRNLPSIDKETLNNMYRKLADEVVKDQAILQRILGNIRRGQSK